MQNFQVFWWLVFLFLQLLINFFKLCNGLDDFLFSFLGTPENSNGGEYRAHYILFLVFCIWCGVFIFVLLIFRIFAGILQIKTVCFSFC